MRMVQWNLQIRGMEKMNKDNIQLDKTILIAICGKSCAGKDTLAKEVFKDFQKQGLPAHYIVSDTTRPKRKNEINNVDYHFITVDKFTWRVQKKKYLEWSEFRGWYYGTNQSELVDNSINIGVFNLQGISSLLKFKEDYFIIPIYIDDSWITRLNRSFKREKKITSEMFRRMITDHNDFKEYYKTIEKFPHSLNLSGIRSLHNRVFGVSAYVKYLLDIQ